VDARPRLLAPIPQRRPHRRAYLAASIASDRCNNRRNPAAPVTIAHPRRSAGELRAPTITVRPFASRPVRLAAGCRCLSDVYVDGMPMPRLGLPRELEKKNDGQNLPRGKYFCPGPPGPANPLAL